MSSKFTKKLKITIFRSTSIKLPPKTIRYRSFKTFRKQTFVQGLDHNYKTNDSYSKLTKIVSEILKNIQSLKSKTITGSQSFLWIKIWEKKSNKTYFQGNTSEGSASSKSFWNTVNPFIRNKGTLSSDNIIIKDPNDTTIVVKGGNLVSIKAKYKIPR